MDQATILLILALAFGFYMTWNIGANDVANAMGTSVGSGALTLKRAVIFASILEFLGAFFVGGDVSETIQKGIINTELFIDHPLILVYGMLSALLATGIWLQLATYYGWPVSTTHSIVGALLGFGLVYGGIHSIKWSETLSIGASWIISPLMGATIAYVLFTFIQRKIFYSSTPVKATKRIAPFLVAIVFTILSLSMIYGGLKHLHLDLPFFPSLGIACIVGIFFGLISLFFILKIHSDKEEAKEEAYDFQVLTSLNKSLKHLRRTRSMAKGPLQKQVGHILGDLEQVSHNTQKTVQHHITNADTLKVEKIFAGLQILSACFVAFAHGANDVANSIGPLAAIFSILKSGVVTMQSTIPMWMLAIGGIGIVIGLATWGWRVIETIGKKITDLTPTRGFAAELAAAITIVAASKIGLPISTTHTLVGAVLGVGLARGISALNLRVLRDIGVAWVITIPAGAGLTIIIFYIIKYIAL